MIRRMLFNIIIIIILYYLAIYFWSYILVLFDAIDAEFGGIFWWMFP